MKEQLLAQFIAFKDDLIALMPKLLVAVVVLLFFWGLGRLIKRVFTRRFQQRWDDSIVVGFTGTAIQYLSYIIGFALALYVLGFGGVAGSLMAGAGVTAIILGLAFKDIAENFLAGFILAINRPFSLNDIIEIENYKGTITHMDIRFTRMRMPDGRDVFIPNSMLVKNILTNYTRDGLIREEFTLGLDMSTDVSRARNFILAHLAKDNQVLKEPKPNVLASQLGNFTIDLEVYFWINAFEFSQQPDINNTLETVKSRILHEVKDLMIENGFNFPNFVVDHKMYDAESEILVKMKEPKAATNINLPELPEHKV
jgi:small conductance mechanosensitive channel